MTTNTTGGGRKALVRRWETVPLGGNGEVMASWEPYYEGIVVAETDKSIKIKGRLFSRWFPKEHTHYKIEYLIQ